MKKSLIFVTIFALLLAAFAARGTLSSVNAAEEAGTTTTVLDFSNMMDATQFISTGSWEVDDGKFVEQSGSGENYACYAYYYKDVTVEWKMELSSGENVYGGISLRKQRPQDGAYQSGINIKIFRNGSVVFVNDAVDGNPVLAELPEGTVNAETENSFKVTIVGNEYKLYVNGGESPAFSVTNDYYGVGGFSLISGNASVYFDDLKVTGKALGAMSVFSGGSGVGGENGGDERYGDVDKSQADSDFNDKIGDTSKENGEPDWDYGEVKDNEPKAEGGETGSCKSSVGADLTLFGVLATLAAIGTIRRRKNA